MTTLTVTAKGQITFRKDLLNHLGVQPGEEIVADKMPDGRIEVRAATATGKISAIFNVLKKPKRQPLSLETIDEIAAQGWAKRR